MSNDHSQPGDHCDGDYCGILLAAGYSRRFGGDKLMHSLSNGLAMACMSALNLQQVLPKTLAVVRPDQNDLAEQFARHGIKTVTVKPGNTPSCAQEGLGLSIATGVAATPNAQGWIIALADMPYIQPASIRHVLLALQQGSLMAAPIFQKRRGHPVGFAAPFGQALRALRGDQGAKNLLIQHHNVLKLVPCQDKGTLADIDTPTDLLACSP